MTAFISQNRVQERIPGLDGLRAMAVAAVLFFHLQMEYASGGFLGVSLFFTLSGYLITRLLLEEHRSSGTIALRHFWARRLRRLMPAALVVLSGVTIVALSSDIFQAATLRGDLWAALGYVANWRSMTASTSYADLFVATPSPLLHFWSLAIEEQFYFIFPIILLALLGRNRRRWIAFVGLSLLWVGSVAASFVGASDNVVYYGTHTRAAELLTGSLVALVLSHRAKGGIPISEMSQRVRYTWNALTVATLAFVIALIITVETGDRWLYQGGLAAFSFVSALLVVGIQIPGPLQWLAERRPVVAVGQMSYGLYLFHWPIFLIMNEDRTGLSGIDLHVLRIAVTVLISIVVVQLIENPIRRDQFAARLRGRTGALVVSLMIIAGAIVFVPISSPTSLAGLDAPDAVVEFGETDIEQSITVAVFGSRPDAVAVLRQVIGSNESTKIIDATDSNCPITAFVMVVERCAPLASRLDSVGLSSPPDLVVVAFGSLERELLQMAISQGRGDIFEVSDRFVESFVNVVGHSETIFLDYGVDDSMANDLEDADLEYSTIATLSRPSIESLSAVYEVIATKLKGLDRRQRILVIGDSSSFGVSAAIDTVAGDRYNVVWAGGRNCPLVKVEKIRWWDGAEFDMANCPSLNPQWRELIDSFQPGRVIVVVAIPEQAEQMYPGESTWHVLGDASFREIHDAFLAEWMALLDERQIELMVFTSPYIRGGALSGAQFAQDDRVNAWNEVIRGWATTWPHIRLIDWAEIIERAELAMGPLRSDGVHLDQSALNRIVADEVVPILANANLSP